MPNSPILTIAIPTRNRSFFLDQNLRQLKKETQDVESGLIEIIVSDNCSTDDTQSVVNSTIEDGLPVCYIRNTVDIGWGNNFLQCFDLARGTYVLILGDDDFFVDGALSKLINCLKFDEYGVVCIQTYGFDHNFRDERPGGRGVERLYDNPGEFIKDVGAFLTLISACVINKKIIKNISYRHEGCQNLPVLHLVLQAVILSEKNLYLKEYMIGCKRNNSANYNFSEIFVNEMWGIIDLECAATISSKWISAFEKRMLIGYYPLYLLQIRLCGEGEVMLNYLNFEKRFGRSFLYKCWLRPILVLPRYLAIPYGVVVTSLGRVWDGDFWRGFYFLKYKLGRLIK